MSSFIQRDCGLFYCEGIRKGDVLFCWPSKMDALEDGFASGLMSTVRLNMKDGNRIINVHANNKMASDDHSIYHWAEIMLGDRILDVTGSMHWPNPVWSTRSLFKRKMDKAAVHFYDHSGHCLTLSNLIRRSRNLVEILPDRARVWLTLTFVWSVSLITVPKPYWQIPSHLSMWRLH